MKRQPETSENLCLRYNLVLSECNAYETTVKGEGESSIITGPVFSNGEVSGGGQRSMTFTSSSSEANELTADDKQESSPSIRSNQSQQKGASCRLGLAPLKVTSAADRRPEDILASVERESGLSQKSEHREQKIESLQSDHVDENVSVSQACEFVIDAQEQCDQCQANYVETDVNAPRSKKVCCKYSNDIIGESAERTQRNQSVKVTDTNVQELHTIITENDVQLMSTRVSPKRSEVTPSGTENVGMASSHNEEESLGQLNSDDLPMNNEEKATTDEVECGFNTLTNSIEGKASIVSDLDHRNERGYNQNISQNSKPFKSSLKKSYNRFKNRSSRVTFSETMTVFSEEFSRPKVVAIRPTDLTLTEACSVYEPPPQYQDSLDLNPPTEYQDTTDDVTFLLEREFDTVSIETASEEGGITEVTNGNCNVKVRLNKGNTTVETCVVRDTLSSVGEDKDVCVEKAPLCTINPGEDIQKRLECETFLEEEKETCENGNSSKNTAVLTLDNVSSDDRISDSLESKTRECVPDVLSGITELETKTPALEKQPSSLSPPLKQFSVDLVHPGKEDEDWQAELNPRSSIQETDSDSSMSSQETIIMMTSEERKRNEEHIRDSLRRYEKLRRRILGDHVSGNLNENLTYNLHGSEYNKLTGSSPFLRDEKRNERLKEHSELRLNGILRTNSQIRETIEKNALRRSLQKKTKARKKYSPSGGEVNKEQSKSPPKSDTSLVEKLKWLTSEISEQEGELGTGTNSLQNYTCNIAENHNHEAVSFEGALPEEPVNGKVLCDQYLPQTGRSLPVILRKKRHVHGQGNFQKRPSSLGNDWEDLSSRDERLATMMIPSDLRDWKIDYQSSGFSSPTSNGIAQPFTNGGVIDDLRSFHAPSLRLSHGGKRGVLTSGASDELERFVKQDLIRIERIRKRYSLSEDDTGLAFGFSRRPSVRGIRPRFGSTTEIMKQMQLQLEPPALTNIGNHVTWWPYATVVNGNRSQQRDQSYKAALVLPGVREEEVNGPDLIPEVHRKKVLPKRTNMRSSTSDILSHPQARNVQEGNPVHFYNDGFASHNRINKRTGKRVVYSQNERGVPEGASSSPRAASDSVFHRESSYGKSEPIKETGVIYYAMNV
ncbi:uncharacterized protein LOC111088910 [Limulus polyphemus]|uniref:Uncharacterized protein LOC111088910 n=1 Tax=Limulus polyphemus TaxID=6850 RepID=A0ABM1TJ58_LIMPO|nr:uncharacterized protein LOC111088910 [Limulus polyphemus]XP_022255915.1 uncharacterized protein LOC111088910 [Limulus polyphemus]